MTNMLRMKLTSGSTKSATNRATVHGHTTAEEHIEQVFRTDLAIETFRPESSRAGEPW